MNLGPIDYASASPPVMIRAAIIPYVRRQGFTGAEVVIGTTPPILRSIEIGRIVDLEEPKIIARKGRPAAAVTKERQITDADVDGAVEQILALLRLHRVEHAAIERIDGEGIEAERSRRIACSIAAALANAGIMTEGALEAFAVPSVSPAPIPVGLAASAPANGRAIAVETQGAPSAGWPATPPHGPPYGGVPLDEYYQPIAPPPKAGLRIVGIDPGSHWVACVVAERYCTNTLDALDSKGWTPLGLRHVASRVFEVGRKVLLGKPKTIQRKNGTIFTQTHRREITDADIGKLLRDVLMWLDPFDVDQAVVERASFFRTGGDGAGARAAGLARAQWIGGELAGALRAATYDVEAGDQVQTVSSALWRRVARRWGEARTEILRVITGAVEPATWRAGVVAAFGGTLPAAAGEHIIDAAGCVLWAVAKPVARVPRPAGVPREKRVRVRGSEDSNAARAGKLAAVRAERAAKGCSCKRRHVRACPMFQPMTYGGARDASA